MARDGWSNEATARANDLLGDEWQQVRREIVESISNTYCSTDKEELKSEIDKQCFAFPMATCIVLARAFSEKMITSRTPIEAYHEGKKNGSDPIHYAEIVNRNIGQYGHYTLASCTLYDSTYFAAGEDAGVAKSTLVGALEARFVEDSKAQAIFRNKEMVHAEECTLTFPVLQHSIPEKTDVDKITEKAADILATAVSQDTDVLSWLAASFTKEISSGNSLSAVRDTLIDQLAKRLPDYFEEHVLPGMLDAMQESEICHAAFALGKAVSGGIQKAKYMGQMEETGRCMDFSAIACAVVKKLPLRKTVDFANGKAIRHYCEEFLPEKTDNSCEHSCENTEEGSIANFLHEEFQLTDISKNGISDPVELTGCNSLLRLLPNDRTLCSNLFAKELALAAIDSLSENYKNSSPDVRGSALAWIESMLPSQILESLEYQEGRRRFCEGGCVEARVEKKEAYAVIAANAQIFCLWEKLVAECQEEDRKILRKKGLNTLIDNLGLIDRLCFDPYTCAVFIDSRNKLFPKPSDRSCVLDELDYGHEATHLFIRHSVWKEIAHALLGIRD